MRAVETKSKDPQTNAIDPVCGMGVEPGKSKAVSVYEGHTYRFCAEACRRAFEADPGRYLERKPMKKRGWFGRYLDRMAEINKKEFGGSGPKCH